MTSDRVAEFESVLVGRNCVVGRREHDWVFDLSGSVRLAVSASWRIVFNGRIALASGDDGQVFGLTTPVDGEAVAHHLLKGKAITAVTLDQETADLTLHFGAATRIDVVNNSMGYEGWQASYAVGDKRWSLIAMGGGEVAFMAE
jgi:hypothetical protein